LEQGIEVNVHLSQDLRLTISLCLGALCGLKTVSKKNYFLFAKGFSVDIIYIMNGKRTVCSTFTAVISSLDKLETGSRTLLLRRLAQ